MQDDLKGSASLAELAKAAGVSVVTIRRRIADGSIVVPKGARRVRWVPIEAIREWSPHVFATLLHHRAMELE
jgi:hypothetical protein